MIVLLLMLFAFSQFGYGQNNLKLRFFTKTACFSCEETVIQFMADFGNDVLMTKDINITANETLIDLPNDGSVSFQWKTLRMSENEVCCWRITRSQIVVENPNGAGGIRDSEFRSNVTLCYSGIVSIGGNDTFICSTHNEDLSSFVHSDRIKLHNNVKQVEVSSTCSSTAASTVRAQCPAVTTSLAHSTTSTTTSTTSTATFTTSTSTSTAVTVISISTALARTSTSTATAATSRATTSSSIMAAPSSSKVLVALSVISGSLSSNLFTSVFSTLSVSEASTQILSSPTMSHEIDSSVSNVFFTTPLPSAIIASYFISSASITTASYSSTVLFTNVAISTASSAVVLPNPPTAVLPISSNNSASISSPVVLPISSASNSSPAESIVFSSSPASSNSPIVSIESSYSSSVNIVSTIPSSISPVVSSSSAISSPIVLAIPSSNPSVNIVSTMPSSISPVVSSISSSSAISSQIVSTISSSSSASSSRLVVSSSSAISSQIVSAISSSSSASNSRLVVSSSSKVINVASTFPPASVNMNCEADGVWEETSPGTTITGTCYSGTVNATRTCYINGTWGSPQCLASAEFLSTLELINDSPEEGLNELQDIITQPPDESISTTQIVFLLNEVALSSTGMSLGANFTTTFLYVSNGLIEMVNSAPYDYDRDVRQSIGSQLLVSLDYLALNSTEASGETFSTEDSLFLKVFEFSQSTDATDDVIGIAVRNNSITLPTDIFKNSLNESVLVGSLFFQNLSNLLSPKDNSESIISSIISSAIDCPSCPTDNFSDNVTVQLHIKDLSSMSGNVHCVFFDFEIRRDMLPTGEWETRGCSSSVDGDIVSCTCNHLTHFAILLSPGVKMAEYGRMNTSILNTIGLVLIPVSLLCMAIVILTYTLFRSLWSIRNYIHTMLCVSLLMAQLVFILGIDKIEEEGLCSAIAVLLQYLFLVTFMWMLMEGVVLYITLVTVFLYNKKRYIIGFTMASYGIPALYMMLIVPIGYLVGVSNIPDHSHFLYYDGNDLKACWLNYKTGFIWSFIVPVIVILVINIGFFIMAIIIMVSHSKKKEQKSKLNFNAGNWLKVCIFLTLVLGITWVVGVLVFRKELLFVAYIMTVFISGQGILIFVVLVPLSTKVREAYLSCWNSLKTKSKLFTSIPIKRSATTAATSFTDYSSKEKLCEKNSSFSNRRSTNESLEKSEQSSMKLLRSNSEAYGQPVDLNSNHYETSHAEVIAMLHRQNSSSKNEFNEKHCDIVEYEETFERQYEIFEHQYETIDEYQQHKSFEHQYEAVDEHQHDVRF